MIYKGKYRIIDNLITACDYEFILKEIVKAIKKNQKLLISPIASHTLVRAHYDKNLKKVLNSFDYLVADSQWVKWSLGFIYSEKAKLKDRVYGPELMLKICHLASNSGYKVFLYGNTKEVLQKLEKKLKQLFLTLKIAGKEKSKFRELTDKEWKELASKLNTIKPEIIFVCLGSPKQEIFSYSLSQKVDFPSVIIPVGAAFDFLSGNKPQAPKWMQDKGLEWFFRLIDEPKRLFGRYLLSLLFLVFVFKKSFKLKKLRKN